MMETALKFIDALKLPAKIFVAIALATGALLFLPVDVTSRLGLEEIVAKYKPYLGAAFLFSACVCIVALITSIGELIWPCVVEVYWVSKGKKRLRNLNPQEKAILAHYIAKQTRQQILDATSAAVKVLELERVIFRASSLGRLSGFSYGLQPWAWDYLNRHPELLS